MCGVAQGSRLKAECKDCPAGERADDVLPLDGVASRSDRVLLKFLQQ